MTKRIVVFVAILRTRLNQRETVFLKLQDKARPIDGDISTELTA